MLMLALTANKFSQRPSSLIGIRDNTTALDLDIACATRLTQFENKRDYKRLESLIKSLAALVGSFFGQKAEPPTNDDDENDIDFDRSELSDDDPDVW